jgi:hypothetical protein
MGAHMMNGAGPTPYGSNQGHMANYPELPYAIQTQSPTNYANGGGFRMATSPLSAYPMTGETTSPGWMSMSSPPPTQFPSHMAQQQSSFHGGNAHLRYPVLEPLIPHLGSIIPLSLACDLIDLYFASSSSAQIHPMSPSRSCTRIPGDLAVGNFNQLLALVRSHSFVCLYFLLLNEPP